MVAPPCIATIAYAVVRHVRVQLGVYPLFIQLEAKPVPVLPRCLFSYLQTLQL
jgi:hypothetical protein